MKIYVFTLLFLFLSGCLNTQIHQGNVIDPDTIWLIQEGDTRFAIESELGSPMVQDAQHPERALYIEDFYNEATGESYTRGIRVTYDTAWRAESIQRFGFE
ncbi:MAG: outer membrane protein assembly factor BamE [Mariprofundaceae bacterium]|nr:outer membrane protein assembly factor BamE [Mariprofundaceae bacterium]